MRVLSNSIINSHSNDIDIKITEAAYALLDPEWSQRDVRMPTSRMYYIISGSAKIWSGEQHITMEAGNLYFIPFESAFNCDCDTELKKLYFHVNIPFLGKHDLFEDFDTILCIPHSGIEEMVRLYKSKSIECLIKLKSILYHDIAHIIELSGYYRDDIPTYNSLTYEAINYIGRQISSKLTVSDVASALAVSKSKLSTAFVSDTGVSIGKYISNELTMKIKLCLINTSLSMNEISDHFDFCDTSYFIRFFKNKTGISPSKFRRKMTNNDITALAKYI